MPETTERKEKMAEENKDANIDTTTAPVETSVDSAGSSPDVETTAMIDDDGFISTTEFEPVKKEEKPEKAEAPETDNSDGAEHNTPKTKPSKDKGFADHPKFQEMHKKIKELEAKEKIYQAQLSPKQKQGKKETTPTYKNVMGMDDDDIVDEFTSNPKQFLANFGQQIFHEFTEQMGKRQEQAAAHSKQETLKSNIKKFFDERPDGQELLASRKIQAFIKENPGHNAFSAYNELTREKRRQSEIDAAVAEAEKKIYKKLKAKGMAGSSAATVGGRMSDDDPPEVKNPDKFGGAKAVAVKRYLKRQAG